MVLAEPGLVGDVVDLDLVDRDRLGEPERENRSVAAEPAVLPLGGEAVVDEVLGPPVGAELRRGFDRLRGEFLNRGCSGGHRSRGGGGRGRGLGDGIVLTAENVHGERDQKDDEHDGHQNG